MGHWPEKHEQVQVKVNVFVDKGVAPLVVALNEYDGVFTIDSCEKSVIHGSPFVSFFCAGCEEDYSWPRLGEFLSQLKSVLDEKKITNYELHMIWPYRVDGYPHGDLIVKPGYVEKIAEALSEAAPEINRRRSESACGKQNTEPRSC